MRVTVYGPNLPSAKETFHVHREGCADTQRGIYLRIRRGSDQGGWTTEATSVRDIVEEVYADIIAENDGQYAEWETYVSDFRFFPCTNGLE